MNSVYFLYNNLHLFDFRAFSKDVRIIPKRFSFTKKCIIRCWTYSRISITVGSDYSISMRLLMIQYISRDIFHRIETSWQIVDKVKRRLVWVKPFSISTIDLFWHRKLLIHDWDSILIAPNHIWLPTKINNQTKIKKSR